MELHWTQDEVIIYKIVYNHFNVLVNLPKSQQQLEVNVLDHHTDNEESPNDISNDSGKHVYNIFVPSTNIKSQIIIFISKHPFVLVVLNVCNIYMKYKINLNLLHIYTQHTSKNNISLLKKQKKPKSIICYLRIQTFYVKQNFASLVKCSEMIIYFIEIKPTKNETVVHGSKRQSWPFVRFGRFFRSVCVEK